MARRFDTNAKYLKTTAAPGLSLTSGTLAFWFRPLFVLNDGGLHMLFELWGPDGSHQVQFQKNSNNLFYAGWYHHGWYLQQLNLSAAWKDRDWNFMLWTYNTAAPGDAYLYLNGAEVGHVTTTTTFDTTNGTMLFGQYTDLNYTANADMARVMYWSRVLTSEERGTLLAAPKTDPSTIANLVFNYVIDGSSPETDTQGNGPSMTVYGSPTVFFGPDEPVGVSSSKANVYGTLGPPSGVSSSKANLYGELSPPQGISISKANVYAIVQGEQRVSQFAAEAVLGGFGDHQVSQFVTEVIYGEAGVGNQAVSQFIVEAVVGVEGVKVSQLPVEVIWGQATPLVDVSQFPVEVVCGQAAPLVDISQMVIEVITSPPPVITSQFVAEAIIEEPTVAASQFLAEVILEDPTVGVTQFVAEAIISPYNVWKYAEGGAVVIDGETVAEFIEGTPPFTVWHYDEPGEVVIDGETISRHAHKQYAEAGAVVVDGETTVTRTRMTWKYAEAGSVVVDGLTKYVSRVNIALRVTRATGEALALDQAGIRATQAPAEVLALDYPEIRDTQTPSEVLVRNNAEILDTQTVCEVLVAGWRRRPDFMPTLARFM